MKSCHVLKMLFTFWHLQPFVLIWFVLITKNMYVKYFLVTSDSYFNI